MKRSQISSSEDFALGETSSLESGFGGDGDEGVERWVELLDAIEAIVSQFDGRDGAAANFLAQFTDGIKHNDPRSNDPRSNLLRFGCLLLSTPREPFHHNINNWAGG